MKKVYTPLCAAALCTLLLAACSEKKPAAAHDPIPVKVLAVSPAQALPGAEYVGTVEEEAGSWLSFEVGGNIRTLPVDEGDRVAAGQVLATLDETSLRSVHRAALAALTQARDAYRRYGSLYRQGTVPEVKWVEIKSKLEQAESAEQVARENLGHAVLRAPFSGVVSTRQAEAGMNAAPGQAVLKLVRIDHVHVKVAVPESEITRWQVGQTATFTVAALGGRGYTAKVSEKGVEADPAAHTYTVKLSLANPGGKLMPGMVCHVKAARTAEAETAATILPPRAVLLDEENRRFVWIAEGGKAVRRTVQVGQPVAGGVVVTSGLKPGDRVITDGNQKVSEGMRVKF